VRDLDSDPDHLRDEQYRDSSNLVRRSDLHVRYRRAPLGVFDWLGTLIPWRPSTAVLDVGCGPGWLWETLAPMLPERIRLTLSDLSPGMVDEAVARASACSAFASVDGRESDARSLAFADGSFDVVVSTYALYHVAEPETAVGEIARVVSDEGVVAIVTNGERHLPELEALRVAVFGSDAAWSVNRAFPPRRAAAALVDLLDRVSWHRYHDELLCTDAEDVLSFVLSSPPGNRATPPQVDQLRAMVEREMASSDGVFRVSKDSGALICTRRRAEL